MQAVAGPKEFPMGASIPPIIDSMHVFLEKSAGSNFSTKAKIFLL